MCSCKFSLKGLLIGPFGYFPLLTPTEECKVDKTKNYESQDIAIPFLCSTELSDQKDEQNLSNIKKVALVIRLETLKTGNKLSPKTKRCHFKTFSELALSFYCVEFLLRVKKITTTYKKITASLKYQPAH